MILGIDPGQTGAAVVINKRGRIIFTYKFKKTDQGVDIIDYCSFLDNIQPYMSTLYDTNSMTVIEKVHSMPGQGVASTFKFGKNYGIQFSQIVARHWPHCFITPRCWTKKMHEGFDDPLPKKRSQAKFRALWPNEDFSGPRSTKNHEGIVDAALLAEYWRLYGNNNNIR